MGTVLSTCVSQTPSLKLACSPVVEHLCSMHRTLGLITNITHTTLPLNPRSWSNSDTFSEHLCQGTLLGKLPLSPYPFLPYSVSPLGSYLYFLKQDFFQREREVEEERRVERERERERDGNVWLTLGTANHCEICNAFLKPVLKVTLESMTCNWGRSRRLMRLRSTCFSEPTSSSFQSTLKVPCR